MSNKGLVLKENISNIAEEIRQSLGISTTYKPRELAQAIHNAILKYKQNNPTATSTNGNLTNAYDVPMVDYELYGKSEQDKINQLFDYTKVTWNGGNPYKGISFTKNDDGSITLDGTCAENFWLTATQWTPKMITPTGHKILCRVTGNIGDLASSRYIGLGNLADLGTGGKTIITSPSDTNLFQIYFKAGDAFNNNKIYCQAFDLTNMYGSGNEPTIEQFEAQYPNDYYPFTNGLSPNPDYPQDIRAVGDLVTSGEHVGKYEIPVKITCQETLETVTVPIYLDRPLYSLPSGVKDKIRFSTGKRTNAIGEVVLDGSERYSDFGYVSGDSNFRLQYDTALPNILTPPTNPAQLLCNRFLSVNRDEAYAKTVVGVAQFGSSLGKIFFCAPASILNTPNITMWKSWLSTHNTQVLYELETPTEENIELPQLNLWEGTNIIEIGTEVQPSSVEYVYITKVNN